MSPAEPGTGGQWTTLASVLERARSEGLLGPGPIPPQIEHASGFAAAAPSGDAPGLVLDLGSGAGLPGLVVALVWASTRVVLLESAERRVAFLRRAVEECGLAPRVEVLHGRAESEGHNPSYRGVFDVVVSRSFGPPAVTAECGSPFLHPGGFLVVSEPPETEASARRWDTEALGLLGLSAVRTVRHGFAYAVAEQVRPCPERFARRVGVPAKRPLF